MKNILLIGSELGKGGAERSISLLSLYLERDYNVTLCILSGRDRKQYYKTCSRVIFIDPPPVTDSLQKVNAWRYRIRRIKEIKTEHKIDVSISFLEGPDYVNVLTKGREKVVLSIRGSKIHDNVITGLGGLIRKKVLIPQLYKKADQIVCVTDALCQELKEHFNIQQSALKTIYNFYEDEVILKHSREPLTSDEEKIFSHPVIVTSGRLHIAKEHDKLIRIFRQLRSTNHVRLLLLGDGERKAELLELCEGLNLTVCDWQEDGYMEADVYFMGFQQNAFKFYKRSKVFALTSSWEGFPNVLAEALICKIPVVSTDCHTGPREILNVTDHPGMPVSQPVRLKVGTLLPLLKTPSEETLNSWTRELQHWLSTQEIPGTEYEKLTQRFNMASMLSLWKEVIEK